VRRRGPSRSRSPTSRTPSCSSTSAMRTTNTSTWSMTLASNVARPFQGRRGGAERPALRLLAAFLFTLVAMQAAAQDVKNVKTVLDAANKAMGGVSLKTIEYAGAGWSSRIGQTYGLNEDWPKYEVTGYTRSIDYDARWSREDYT